MPCSLESRRNGWSGSKTRAPRPNFSSVDRSRRGAIVRWKVGCCPSLRQRCEGRHAARREQPAAPPPDLQQPAARTRRRAGWNPLGTAAVGIPTPTVELQRRAEPVQGATRIEPTSLSTVLAPVVQHVVDGSFRLGGAAQRMGMVAVREHLSQPVAGAVQRPGNANAEPLHPP